MQDFHHLDDASGGGVQDQQQIPTRARTMGQGFKDLAGIDIGEGLEHPRQKKLVVRIVKVDHAKPLSVSTPRLPSALRPSETALLTRP
ncbi:hypothetical protein DCM75_23345 [Bradyrhizobium sp. WBOS02]|uniref:Uncharacterized protein n=1 Tax=Bradyrhizobium betae TaxID=244734 RepID=A0AAE9SUW7_9BRAD|nr:hypothetical protein [Bradyrhizobium sp. WBOS1]MDD1601374.1 hypothetical protein [Bradyrhizobium sp. WBOS16]UUO37079.1 hypothetical protein DCK84_22590 [Bradyrhizobium sp. WBOS01]UUO43382.1 hypothetical protein DCM75_23345 [Bradyrhizobium sp. WBOS02]UUO53315.1 hypothetical protein DCM79_10240 [Bradyrhizobium sp. WBOS07]UUO67319.1 hypothetical protein DCM83_20350 [Bradyrhizobium betae]